MKRPEIPGLAQKKESTALLRRYIANKVGGERRRDRGEKAQRNDQCIGLGDRATSLQVRDMYVVSSIARRCLIDALGYT